MQVEKVLQIASLDKKNFKLKLEPTDIHDIIEKALVNINLTVESRGGTISSQLNATNSQLHADKVHLTNIVYNLVDNANKYSPEIPEINIRTENISKGIIIKISDKGIGMSKEAVQKIFDRFFRVSTGNVHDVKGFGLGLSYVKNIVDMHQGEITVKTDLGKGSTFKEYIYLIIMASFKILLVEDDPNLGQILNEYLTVKGYETKLCRDGEEGVRAFKKEAFDLCLFDVMLPKKDGFSMAKRSESLIRLLLLFSLLLNQ